MSDDEGLAPVEWDELSDGELRQRLVNRGIDDYVAGVMVNDRECCNDCRLLITAALD